MLLYLYDEYRSTNADSLTHAREIRSRGDWIPGLMDVLGNDRNQDDGYRLVEIYRQELGLSLQGVTSQPESNRMETSRLMSTGQLKVFASLALF